MHILVSLRREAGTIVARAADYPQCEGRDASRDEAIAKLRRSLLFWLETCPCDQTTDPGLVLTVSRDET